MNNTLLIMIAIISGLNTLTGVFHAIYLGELSENVNFLLTITRSHSKKQKTAVESTCKDFCDPNDST